MTPYCAKQASRSHKALSIAAATTSQKLSLHVNNLDRASGHAGVLSQLSQHKDISKIPSVFVIGIEAILLFLFYSAPLEFFPHLHGPIS